MRRVAVVGCGVAGTAAALQASRCGSEVTVYEAGGCLPAPRSSWLGLLDGKGVATGAQAEALSSANVTVVTGAPVRAVTAEGKVAPGGSARFDAIVLATGSKPADLQPFPAKDGVYRLATARSYAELGRDLGGLGRVCIVGRGPTAMLVADKTLSRHVPTMIMSSDPLSGLFDADCAEALLAGARSAGAGVVLGDPERLIGSDSLEGVLAGGAVYPCDGLAVLPTPVPNPPFAPAELGPAGGVLVDDSMASSSPRIFAAGDSAELRHGPASAAMMGEPAARLAGEVAGAGAAGATIRARPVGLFAAKLFGLEASSVGLSLQRARAAGRDAARVTSSSSEFTCSLVYDARDLSLLGVQAVGPGALAAAYLGSLALSSAVSLDQLGRLETPESTDITALTEAARRELGKRAGCQ